METTPKMNILNCSVANLAPKQHSTAHAVKITLQEQGKKDCIAANSVQQSFIAGLAQVVAWLSDEEINELIDLRHDILAAAEEAKRQAAEKAAKSTT